ncbi:hypothetical protein JW948_02435 [bacterium]|nr:hypothetical protein [bacterium]
MAVLLILSICGTALHAFAPPDSTGSGEQVIQSTTGAMLRSALMPGWGQAYNHQWLKALMVLGAESGLAGNAVYMNRKALVSQTDDEREFYRHNRNTFVWWFAAVYMLNILDAYVDAHLFQFDVGPVLDPAAEFRIGPQDFRVGLTFRTPL